MSRRQTLWRLLSLIRSLWGMMLFSITMRTLNQTSSIAILTLGVWGVSLAVARPGAGDLRPILVALVVMGRFKGVFRYLEQFSGHYVAFHLLAIMRDRFYRRIEPLAPAVLMDQRSGDVVSRATGDVERIEVFYAHTIAPAATAVLVPALALTVLARFDGLLAVTLLLFLAGVGLLVPWLADRLGRRLGMALRRVVADVNAHFTDSIQGLREIVAFGRGGDRRREIGEGGERLVGVQARAAHIAGLQNGLSDGLVATGTLSVLGVGLWLVGQGRLDPLLLPPIVALTMTTFGPVLAAASVTQDINQALAGAGRLFALMDQTPAVRDSVTAPPPPPVEPSIYFDDVYFCYQVSRNKDDGQVSRNKDDGRGRHAAPWVHNGLSFDVPAGRTVALVGASGDGKSTVVNLLLRFWDANKGHVRLGQYDVRDFPQEDLRRRVAVVSQHTYLFNTTIKENLRLGNPQADETEIERAARLANIHDFVVSLPQGYDTPVGEMGVKLSGGQRQRLAIARALLKDAPILVLDEATSNLDAETERDIQSAIHQLTQGRTTLIIAHRLSTVVNADEILVMDGGRIVERGQHAELLAQGGVYARLFAIQQDELGKRQAGAVTWTGAI
jgi:ATP-binding cassette subfamily B protein